MYSYCFKSLVVKDLKKLPKEVQKRIIKKLDYFISVENPLQFAESLVNYELGMYRFRIGNYRVIFDIEETMIVILAIGHRREIYKK
ncbi:MAG: type II toxin-antitoxin system RelE/ParE family toxin [bacterium]|nr:type II toxin-antitoxin system RelE/ParE family toxin [bacterium]